ncbi:GntR family transcriptional regulator [Pantoea cypripedii]|uniref:GntR family transcriptional regulator n=1 Tax=Pantoea cypripedii TaxID=55209 RepID=A0A6B9GF55_PANCY|nr:GntR family transcriptional regulator [Pantoea cypripedii]QGY32957.1 GntR family transcriptional regulator [Pantoea cypripedii]
MALKRVITPVNKSSVEARATKALRDFILSGSLQPGERIIETELSEKMSIARATLRVSLARLAAEGLVVKTPYTSWEIRSLTADDAWELWTLRASLESLAVRLAAENMTHDLRQRIEDAMTGLIHACASGDVIKASEGDLGLHRTIIESVGHNRLANHYRLVEQQVRLYIETSNSLMINNLGGIVDQHIPMIDALLAGDAENAAREAWLHNQSEGGKLVAWLHQKQRIAGAGK